MAHDTGKRAKTVRIDRSNLPVVFTRKALLVLDLQNDLVSPGSDISAQSPPGWVEDCIGLAVQFRAAGNDVIWVRSEFAGSRPVNSENRRTDSVITDRELAQVRRAAGGAPEPRSTTSQRLLDIYSKILDNDDGEGDQDLDELSDLKLGGDKWEGPNDETFLTLEPNHSARFVLPGSAGAEFIPLVKQHMDNTKDLIFLKSYYSAFKDGTLVQTMRAKFVTEIYLCGALTNISVFATAMDAAQHGYAITIVEDCLGYRSRERHDAALTKLTEFTGCDMVRSEDIMEDMRPITPRIPRASQLEASQRPEQDYDFKSRKPASPSHKRKEHPSTEQLFNGVHSPSPVTPKSQLDDDLPELGNSSTKKVQTKIKTRRRPSGSPSGHSSKAKESAPASRNGLDKSASANAAKAEPGSPNKLRVKPNHGDGDIEKPEGSPMRLDPPEVNTPLVCCEGDTTIINNLLDAEAAKDIFERVRDEVLWQKMSHRGGDVPRLISVQGEVAEDGSVPIYRHPADESPPLLPFTPTVSQIRAEVEKALGHPVNHVLTQFYRDGNDYISEHSDKTLDIVPNTYIANVSLGAQRTMVFRTKKDAQNRDGTDSTDEPSPRKTERVPLAHNSMCKMGLVTNKHWLHGIRQDKRMKAEKSEAELAYGGGRISLTFRLIGTFIDKDEKTIWGQGATVKTKEDAKPVINGETPDAEKMVRAFGIENHSTNFCWRTTYGTGFDVLHISNLPKLFLSGDLTVDLGVKTMLSDFGIAWAEGNSSPFRWQECHSTPDAILESRVMKFVDNDECKSTVEGDMAVILYLDTFYGQNQPRSRQVIAQQYTRLQKATDLLRAWRGMPQTMKQVEKALANWERIAGTAPFLAGENISAVDFTLVPLFIELRKAWPVKNSSCIHIHDYVDRMITRESVKTVLGSITYVNE